MAVETEARQLIDAWIRAFVTSDLEAILGLYAPNATFTGTSSQRYTRDPGDVRAYFERVLCAAKPAAAEVLECEIQNLGDVAIATALDNIAWEDGRKSKGRVTFVLRRMSDTWRIESFHRSEVPRF